MDSMRRNVALLALCQALLMTGNVVLVATSGLVGFALAPAPEWATLALGLQFAGMTCATMPASLLMRRIGRRNGFLLGAGLGVLGAMLCTYGVWSKSYVWFCSGSAVIGFFNAVGQYYRFAAADVATLAYRPRAISLVMAGGVVAAFVGPNLANWSKDLLTPTLFGGSYASLIFLYLASLGVLLKVNIPRPTAAELGGEARPLRVIARQPRFVVAALSALVGYGTMNLIMTATPLAMHHSGFVFADTAFVIQGHVLAMFAPSFFTGALIDRFGVVRIIATGTLLLCACVIVNVSGVTLPVFITGLVLLGVGWNFMFIGATTLLTDSYYPAEKAKSQGFNDLLLFGTVAATAFSSGVLHHALGWDVLNYGVLPPLVLVLVACVWLQRKQPLNAVPA